MRYPPRALRYSSVTASATVPLQLHCTSVTAPSQLPRELRHSSVSPPLHLPISSVTASVTAQLYTSVTAPLHLRYSSVTAPGAAPLQFRYRSDIKLLLLLRLRYSFRYSIATAGSAPLQPSDTAPLQLRDKSVTAPLISLTVSVTSPVTGEHFCHSRGLQMMVEPRPNLNPRTPKL